MNGHLRETIDAARMHAAPGPLAETPHIAAAVGARWALEVVERQIVQQMRQQHDRMGMYLDKRDPTYADVARANVCRQISAELMRTLTTVIETRSTL